MSPTRASLLLVLVLAGSARAAPPDESPLGYIEMPPSDDGTWVMTSPPGSGRNWGQPVFIRHLILVAREWRRRHPEGPVLRLGDLSKPDGTDFPPHKTHKDGLTADVFTSPRNVCHVSFDDQQLTLELAQLFHDYGARQILYNGDLVTQTVPVAQKWPDHDDHFHVVIDPSRVPDEGELLVLPEGRVRDGAFVSGAGLADDRTGLELAWRILGQARLKSWRVIFDDTSDEGAPLHDSGEQRAARTTYPVPIAIEDGRAYRWKLELDVGADRPLGFGWQRLTTDLAPPAVEAVSPRDDAPALEPTLVWRYRKQGVAQASFSIEVDADANHRRVSATLGPFDGAADRYALQGLPLRRGKKYHWRVIVTDAHGNAAASEWQTFKVEEGDGTATPPPPPPATTEAGRPQPPPTPPRQPDGDRRVGRVNTDTLNLRRGPSTGDEILLTLRRGAPLTIIRDQGEWLEVETPGPSGPVRGFVYAQYVEVGDE
jgi:hypothetical protein